jgi:hypothetical protein
MKKKRITREQCQVRVAQCLRWLALPGVQRMRKREKEGWKKALALLCEKQMRAVRAHAGFA